MQTTRSRLPQHHQQPRLPTTAGKLALHCLRSRMSLRGNNPPMLGQKKEVLRRNFQRSDQALRWQIAELACCPSRNELSATRVMQSPQQHRQWVDVQAEQVLDGGLVWLSVLLHLRMAASGRGNERLSRRWQVSMTTRLWCDSSSTVSTMIFDSDALHFARCTEAWCWGVFSWAFLYEKWELIYAVYLSM
jgi:hypothetical protein